jgi:hypothetical protein
MLAYIMPPIAHFADFVTKIKLRSQPPAPHEFVTDVPPSPNSLILIRPSTSSAGLAPEPQPNLIGPSLREPPNPNPVSYRFILTFTSFYFSYLYIFPFMCSVPSHEARRRAINSLKTFIY